jgi:hypothetical protein
MSATTKTLGLLLLLLAVPAAVSTADHIPVPPSGAFEIEGSTSILLDTPRFDPLLEAVGRLEAEEDFQLGYRALTVGSYYRLQRNLKVGLFYRLQSGARHDDDWIDLAPGWAWLDTRDRLEHLLIVDVSPRFQLGFLPGRNWVLMIKGRYLLNSYELEQSILVRPGLTYFWMIDREPFLTISFNYGLYFPLNFGSTLIYEQAPYLSVLYHLSPAVKLELTGTYKSVVWSSSADTIANGDSYQVTYRAFGVGLGVLVMLRP